MQENQTPKGRAQKNIWGVPQMRIDVVEIF